MAVMPEAQLRGTRRAWLLCATGGFAVVAAVLLTTVAVIVDKPRFGWLVGKRFLETIVIALVLGAIAMAIGVWNANTPSDWRRWTLLTWAGIAAVSPAFGLMFVLPWSALALSAPAAIVAMYTLWRTSPATVANVPS
jgi:hypothetical protein